MSSLIPASRLKSAAFCIKLKLGRVRWKWKCHSVSVIAHLYTKGRNKCGYWVVTVFIAAGWRKLQQCTNKSRNIMLSKTVNNSLIWRGNTMNITVLIVSASVWLLSLLSCNIIIKCSQAAVTLHIPAKSLWGWCRRLIFLPMLFCPNTLSSPFFGQQPQRKSKERWKKNVQY